MSRHRAMEAFWTATWQVWRIIAALKWSASTAWRRSNHTLLLPSILEAQKRSLSCANSSLVISASHAAVRFTPKPEY